MSRKSDPKYEKDPCKRFACRIQDCLNAHNFQEDRCLRELEDMRLCCVKWQGDSHLCKGINLEKTYLDKTNNTIEKQNTNQTNL